MCGAHAGAAGIGAMHAVCWSSMDCRNNMLPTMKQAVKLSSCMQSCRKLSMCLELL